MEIRNQYLRVGLVGVFNDTRQLEIVDIQIVELLNILVGVRECVRGKFITHSILLYKKDTRE